MRKNANFQKMCFFLQFLVSNYILIEDNKWFHMISNWYSTANIERVVDISELYKNKLYPKFFYFIARVVEDVNTFTWYVYNLQSSNKKRKNMQPRYFSIFFNIATLSCRMYQMLSPKMPIIILPPTTKHE